MLKQLGVGLLSVWPPFWCCKKKPGVEKGSRTRGTPLPLFSQSRVSVILLTFTTSSLIPSCCRNFSSRDSAELFSGAVSSLPRGFSSHLHNLPPPLWEPGISDLIACQSVLSSFPRLLHCLSPSSHHINILSKLFSRG